MQQFSLQALGTTWNIEFLEAVDSLEVIQAATTEFLEEFESRYSRFRTESWLSILNSERIFKNPDPEFVDLLTQSLEYYKATSGIFNIAIGERMNAVGYDANYSFTTTALVPQLPMLNDILQVSTTEINLRSGSLDLGGIGKGYAIDLLAQFFMKEQGLQFFVINGGGDIYATSDNDAPISVALRHPTDVTQSIGKVDLFHQGFAASSPYVRSWNDKKTGEGKNHLHTDNNISTYVVAENCTAADVYATTLAVNPDSMVPETLELLLLKNLEIIKTSELFSLHS